MRCSKCKKLLVEYSAGRLNGEEKRAIQQHIASCAECQSELDGFRDSLEFMNDARNLERLPKAPEDFADRVMDRIREDVKPVPRFRRFAFGAIASCCLIVIAALFLYTGRDVDRTPALPEAGSRAVALPKADITTSDQLGADVGEKLVRMLEQTLEVIEGDDQEWEVEI